MIVSVLVLVVVCVISRFAIATLNLHAQNPFNQDKGISWKFSLHGVLYTLAGIMMASAVMEVASPLLNTAALLASIALVIGATFAPSVDWSHDSKIKRAAFCIFNYAYGAIAATIMIPWVV